MHTVPEPTGPVARYLDWLRLRNLSEQTIRHARYDLPMVERFAGAPLTDLTAKQLRAWRESIADRKPGTVYRKCSVVTNFYRWAMAEGLVTDDPSSALVRPKLPRRLPRPIAEEKLQNAIATAPERLRPWLVLAAYAGLRAAEIAGLRRDHVLDAEDPPLLVIHGKGDKERIVPASPVVLAALRPYLDDAAPWLFPRRDEQPGPTTAAQVSRLGNEYLHDLGLPDTLHSLRHRFATQLLRSTKNLRLVQEMLGHQSPGTTAIYTAYDPAEAARAVGALGTEAAPEPAARTGDHIQHRPDARALAARAADARSAAGPAPTTAPEPTTVQPEAPRSTAVPARASTPPAKIPDVAQGRAGGPERPAVAAEHVRLEVDQAPAVLRLALYLFAAGLSRNDIAALKWADVDIPARLLMVRSGVLTMTPGLLRTVCAAYDSHGEAARMRTERWLLGLGPDDTYVFLGRQHDDPRGRLFRVPGAVLSSICSEWLRERFGRGLHRQLPDLLAS